MRELTRRLMEIKRTVDLSPSACEAVATVLVTRHRVDLVDVKVRELTEEERRRADEAWAAGMFWC